MKSLSELQRDYRLARIAHQAAKARNVATWKACAASDDELAAVLGTLKASERALLDAVAETEDPDQ